MWCNTSLASWACTISDLCKRPKSSIKLEPIIFGDDAKLFCGYNQTKIIFETVNCELEKMDQWLKTNRFSLNVLKTNYFIKAKFFLKCQL